MEKIINVKMGEVQIGRNKDILKTLLGSCVGIGLINKKRGYVGLAHCLLGKADQEIFDIGGKFVDQALYSMTKLLEIDSQHKKEIIAIVVGGGNMTLSDDVSSNLLVGKRNTDFALEHLKKNGFAISYTEVGGRMARNLKIYCETGLFKVSQVPRLKVA